MQTRATYPFGSLEFSEFTSTVNFEACTKDLDFVGVHCCTSIRIEGRARDKKAVHVFAIKILTFSSRLGEFVAIVLSKMKPDTEIRGGKY